MMGSQILSRIVGIASAAADRTASITPSPPSHAVWSRGRVEVKQGGVLERGRGGGVIKGRRMEQGEIWG